MSLSLSLVGSEGRPFDAAVRDLSRALDDFGQRQIPFATSLAINLTLNDARAALIDQLPKRFTIRNKFLEKGIRVRPSSKRHLEGRVFTLDEILRLQIEGGAKPRTGHATPLARGVKGNAKGIFRKAKRPAALRDKPKHFVAPLRGGGRGLFKRVGKKRSPILLLWRLHDGTVKIDSAFDFEGIAHNTFRRRFEKNFGLALGKALATAKR